MPDYRLNMKRSCVVLFLIASACTSATTITGISAPIPPSALTPPKGLKGRGLEEWENLCPELVRSGVLTVGDRKCFETYCRTVDDENRYEKLIAKVEDEPAQRLGYPQHLLRIRTQLKQYEDALGLTPSSRAGIKVKKPPDAGEERKRRFFGVIDGSAPA